MAIDLSVSTVGRWKGHDPASRFWRHVQKAAAPACWLWTGTVQPRGYPYGRLAIRNRLVLAHRLSWMLHRGDVPDGLCVLHRCDNPRCVNPDHLFLGTQRDNAADAIAKGRKAYPPPPTGEGHHQAKLTREEARSIYRLAKAGAPHCALSDHFGVGRSVISRIASGRSWKAATEDLRA